MGKEEDEEGMTSNDLYVVSEEPRHFGVRSDNPSPFQRGDPLRVSSRRYKKQPPGRVSAESPATTISNVSEESAITEWEEDVEEEYYETNCNIMQKLDELRKSMEDLTASHDDTFDKLVELDVPEAELTASRTESPTLTNIMRKYSNYEMDNDVENFKESVGAITMPDSVRKISANQDDELLDRGRKTSESYLDTSGSSRRVSESSRKISSNSQKTSESHRKTSTSSRKASESFMDRAEEIRRKYSKPESDSPDQSTAIDSTTTNVSDIVRKYSQPEKKEAKEDDFEKYIRKYSRPESEYTSTNSAFPTSSADVSTEASSAPLSTIATSMKVSEVPTTGGKEEGRKSSAASGRLQKLLTKYSNEEDEFATKDATSEEQVVDRDRRRSSTTRPSETEEYADVGDTSRRKSSITEQDGQKERRQSFLAGYSTTSISEKQNERRKSSLTGYSSLITSEEQKERKKSSLSGHTSANTTEEQNEEYKSVLNSYASTSTTEETKERRKSSLTAYSSTDDQRERRKSSLTRHSFTAVSGANESDGTTSLASTYSSDAKLESNSSTGEKDRYSTDHINGTEESSSMSVTEILRKYSRPENDYKNIDMANEVPTTSSDPSLESCSYVAESQSITAQLSRKTSETETPDISIRSTTNDDEDGSQNLKQLLRKYSNIDGSTTPPSVVEESFTTDAKEVGGGLQRSRRGSRASRKNSRNSRRSSRNSRRSSMTDFTFEKPVVNAPEASHETIEKPIETAVELQESASTYTRRYSIPEAEYGMTDTAEKVVQTSATEIKQEGAVELTVGESSEETTRVGSRRSSEAEEAVASERLQNLLRKYSNAEDQYQEPDKDQNEGVHKETTQHSQTSSTQLAHQSHEVTTDPPSEHTAELSSSKLSSSSSGKIGESSSSNLSEILRRYSNSENKYEETGRLEERVSSHPINAAKRSRRSSRYSCEGRRESLTEQVNLDVESNLQSETTATSYSGSRKSSSEFGELRERRKSSASGHSSDFVEQRKSSSEFGEQRERRQSSAGGYSSDLVEQRKSSSEFGEQRERRQSSAGGHSSDFVEQRKSSSEFGEQRERRQSSAGGHSSDFVEQRKSSSEFGEQRERRQSSAGGHSSDFVEQRERRKSSVGGHSSTLSGNESSLRKSSLAASTYSSESATDHMAEEPVKGQPWEGTEDLIKSDEEEEESRNFKQLLRKYSGVDNTTYLEPQKTEKDSSTSEDIVLQDKMETSRSMTTEESTSEKVSQLLRKYSSSEISYNETSRNTNDISTKSATDEIQTPAEITRKISAARVQEDRRPSFVTLDDDVETCKESSYKSSSRRSSKATEEEFTDQLKEKLKGELINKLSDDSAEHHFNDSKLAEPSEATTTSSTPSSPVRVVNFVSTNSISRRFSHVEDDDYINRELAKESTASHTESTPSYESSSAVGDSTPASNELAAAYNHSTSAYNESSFSFNKAETSDETKSTFTETTLSHEESPPSYDDSKSSYIESGSSYKELPSSYKKSEYEESKSHYDSTSSPHNESLSIYDKSESSYSDSKSSYKESSSTYKAATFSHAELHAESTTPYRSSIDSNDVQTSTSKHGSSSWSSKSTQSLHNSTSPSPSSYNSTSSYASNTLSSRRYSSMSAQDLSRELNTDFRPLSVRASSELFREDPVFQRSKTQYAAHVTIGSPRWSPASSRRSSIASTSYESNRPYLRKTNRLGHSDGGGYSSSHKTSTSSTFAEENHCVLDQPLPSTKRCDNWPNCSTLSGGEPLCCTNYVTNNLLVRKLTCLQEKTKNVKLDLEESFKTIDNLNTYVTNLEEKRKRLRVSITDFEQKLRY